jgi:hypothetical protein
MIVKINDNTPYARTIGEIFPDQRLFKKNVSLSKHLFKKLDAWGFDAQYFTDVLKPSNYDIEIYEKEEHKLYKTNAETIAKKGQFYHFNKEEDHKAQIFLPRRYWNILLVPKQ